jgi:hypothetical protein
VLHGGSLGLSLDKHEGAGLRDRLGALSEQEDGTVIHHILEPGVGLQAILVKENDCGAPWCEVDPKEMVGEFPAEAST